MTFGEEKPDLEELAHYGVKGMKWGIRKDRDDSGINPLQTQGSMTVDPRVPQSTKDAAKAVSSLVEQRYGFHVSAVKTMSIDPSHPDYHPDMIGYVANNPGKRDGVIHVSQKDVRKPLKDAENTGWFGEGCGNPKAFLTHESAHAIFHSEQTVKNGLLGAKVVGGNMKARDKAIKAAVKQAKRDGIPLHMLGHQISGYAGTAGNREELEAEMFSQYHWSPNPPPFIRVWGQTLHQELGVNDTPFREAVKHE